jgi:hypothetical protein
MAYASVVVVESVVDNIVGRLIGHIRGLKLSTFECSWCFCVVP